MGLEGLAASSSTKERKMVSSMNSFGGKAKSPNCVPMLFEDGSFKFVMVSYRLGLCWFVF